MLARRRGCHCLTASSMNSSFLLTVRFHPLPCFPLIILSVSIFRNNLFCPCTASLVIPRWVFSTVSFLGLKTLIKTRSFTENTTFIVYMIAWKERHRVTTVRCTGKLETEISPIFTDWCCYQTVFSNETLCIMPWSTAIHCQVLYSNRFNTKTVTLRDSRSSMKITLCMQLYM